MENGLPLDIAGCGRPTDYEQPGKQDAGQF
jgi:hypothetical protein